MLHGGEEKKMKKMRELCGITMDSTWIRLFLKELDGEFLEAVNTRQHNLPRICIFSGVSGEDMVMFIDAFPETGLEPAVFAALVPNSADKYVAELIDEIMGDHEMLVSRFSLLIDESVVLSMNNGSTPNPKNVIQPHNLCFRAPFMQTIRLNITL
ncbi:zinc finger CCHC-type and RNA-binding motif-containing protein 1-like [Hibiscus syriacus]|uniref:Zinc finger CCHC-type and RNA-binding motif-containing protein 1-like n=1 Tax=Hibiscus syriacus TaxID=106335 RepID=A0A6A2YRP9_HIBSY|nr:zinc finger CCHC-type and RNA-binding motif-containing protein 1-like [Hibiscus syriacus]